MVPKSRDTQRTQQDVVRRPGSMRRQHACGLERRLDSLAERIGSRHHRYSDVAVGAAVVILVGAMPSAVSAMIFAAETHLDEELVASIVALSICLGVAMLPWLPRLAPMLQQ